ncbi:alcohol dehydrogenase catalytic domain-containing protein, partial [Lacticaseibacillus nasuensis]|uniref:quinone oxidoreductase family protein n=1 Tax=Lacticaseibacillus nasuensis TaxID=944671 RepID=UPI001584FC17
MIETMAVGLNNRERLTRQTAPAGPLTLPGADVAGIVRNLGTDIANVAVGDRVVAHTSHAYAEWAVSRQTDTVVLPSTVDFVTAASVVTTGITAYRAVTDYAHLRAGETLIVRGASGGVGNLIVQLAASLGVKVIGVASAAHQATVLAAGAQEFVAYDRQNVTAALRGR